MGKRLHNNSAKKKKMWLSWSGGVTSELDSSLHFSSEFLEGFQIISSLQGQKEGELALT